MGLRSKGSLHSGQPSSTKYLMLAGVNCLMKAILSFAAHDRLHLICSRIFLITSTQRRNGHGVILFLLSAAVIALMWRCLGSWFEPSGDLFLPTCLLACLFL